MTNIKERIDEYSDIRKNPLKFLEYVKIVEPGYPSVDFQRWPHLIELWEALHTYSRIIVLKSKQIGFSWTMGAYVDKHIITVPNANVAEISNKELSAQALMAKTQIIHSNLPQWMQIFNKHPDSSEAFGLDKTLDGRRHGSIVRALTSTKTASLGENLSLCIHDEAEFHEYFKENFGHTDPASKRGQLVVGSTSDKTNPDSFFKKLYIGAKNGENDFKPFFFGALCRPDRDMEWYKKAREIAESQGILWEFEQNYPLTEEEALSPMSAVSCFKKDVLDLLWDKRGEPETRQGFIHIFKEWQPGLLYGAGVDVAEGVGLDYSVLTILARYGLQSEVAAIIYSNEIPTDLFSYYVNEVCKEYKKPTLLVENNGIGDSVISRLLESNYPKLYYTGKEAGKQGKAGWTSSTARKAVAFNTLVNDVNEGNVITRFSSQIQEMMEAQFIKGKFEFTGKTHGDTVISLMLANLALGEKKSGSKVTVTYPRYARPSYTPSLRY